MQDATEQYAQVVIAGERSNEAILYRTPPNQIQATNVKLSLNKCVFLMHGFTLVITRSLNSKDVFDLEVRSSNLASNMVLFLRNLFSGPDTMLQFNTTYKHPLSFFRLLLASFETNNSCSVADS